MFDRYSHFFISLLFLFLSSFSLFAQKDSTDLVSTWVIDFFYHPDTFTIYTDTAYNYNYDVDWNNDGIFDSLGVTGDISHRYANNPSNDTVTIRIRGTFPRILFGSKNYSTTPSAYFLLYFNQWGETHLKDLSSAFYQCKRMRYKAKDIPNLDSVTNLSNMFNDTYYFNGAIGNWDVSTITNMSGMFEFSGFNQPIGNWDVSKVTDMSNMFRLATYFNQSIGNWDVSKVKNMSKMFDVAISFNQSIRNWNVSQVTNMQGMFNTDTSFNQPIGNWKVDSVKDMSEMFRKATSFNQAIGNWDVSSVKDMRMMFEEATSFNQPIGNWNVDSVSIIFEMFSSATSFNQPLGNWNVNIKDVTGIFSMFTNATSFNQNLSNWNISNLSNADYVFNHTAISVNNYDSILIAWQAQAHQKNVSFGALGLHYCLGDSARQLLIADGWTINGDTLDCNFVGIEKNKTIKTEFSLFPNPTNGIVTLTIDKQPNDIPFCVYNQKGQLIKKVKLTEGENKIDLSGYSNGLYYITNGKVGEKLLLER